MPAHKLNPTRLVRAYDAGCAAAIKLRIGSIFLGAFGHAKQVGFANDTLERTCFTEGFMTYLQQPVQTRHGRVVQLGGSYD